MRPVRITALRQTVYEDLIAQYENKLENPCCLKTGQTFTAYGMNRPEGFCESAWITIAPLVNALSCGAKGLYDGWMKNDRSVMLSCNDGFRPMSFLIEALEEEV